MPAASSAPVSSGRLIPESGSGTIEIVPPVAITAVGRGPLGAGVSLCAVDMGCRAERGEQR